MQEGPSSSDASGFEPGYLRLHRSGELARRAARAERSLGRCRLCPRVCGVDRLRGDLGECRTGPWAVVSSAHLHFGEESPLVGRGGSGTIFFAHCNMRCVYCQNAEISQDGEGRETTGPQLASIMLKLQEAGAENINLVSPSHVVAQVLRALVIAADQGLRLPLVYNTGGYDALTTLRLLDGVVDIYLPDAKYADEDVALRYSGVEHYPHVNRQALREMHRQVGDLQVDASGVARRGLLVRHLVLPEGLAGTAATMRFLAHNLSKSTFVNVMDQYRPCYRASRFAEIARPVRWSEVRSAVEAARAAGLHRFAD